MSGTRLMTDYYEYIIDFLFIIYCIFIFYFSVKKKFPATGLDRPLGFQEVEAPEFLDSRHMKMVR